LHGGANPRMYGGLTANIPGCAAFSLPVQRRNLRSRRGQRLSRSLHGQRCARLTRSGGFEPERRPVPGIFLLQGRFETRQNRLSGSKTVRYAMAGECYSPRGPSAKRQGGSFCRQHVQTGRRLMRQTVLPTKIHGTIAPERSESFARRFAPVGHRSARRQGLRFGLPLTPESGGPSRHRAAQYARAMHRARRRQEFQNAQQDVDRCYPPGRDPGRRGPRQSRRRI
jgi:hypothetical protein